MAGVLILLCFAGYSYWKFKIKVEKETMNKVADAAMITGYIMNEAVRIMGSGRFQNLEEAFRQIKEIAQEKGITFLIFRPDGREAFSDNQTAEHVLAMAKEALGSGEKTLSSIPVEEVIAEAETVLKRGRPKESIPYYDDPDQRHDKKIFEEALRTGESEDPSHHGSIEKFVRINRDECGSVCHSGENAIIKMIIDQKGIQAGLARELGWEMARMAGFVAGLLLVIGLFSKLEEINRLEREEEREKYLEDLEDAYGKLQNVTQELAQRNEEVGKYAGEMEQLADERSKQLIHADRMVTLGIMSAGVAHEINNPTAFIKSNANMLKIFWDRHIKGAMEKAVKENPPDLQKLECILAEMPKLLQSIEEGTVRISKIVDSLKDFSRQEKSSLELGNICQCIEEAVKFSKFNTSLKNEVKIDLDLPGDIPDIQLSRQEIEQVLINLFTNAAHAMEGIKDALLYVAARQTEGHIEVTVSDNGKGMNSETLNRIFTPFFTTKSKEGGTGLGLPICYNIIKKHGGKIEAVSSPGKGAIFTITLPKD